MIEHLRDSGKISTIALWGRSMGAATALLHGERDPSIAGMILGNVLKSLLLKDRTHCYTLTTIVKTHLIYLVVYDYYVTDSSFTDLQGLAEEMVEKGRQNGLFAPSFVVSIAIRMIRGSVLKIAEFDIRTLAPIEHADKCFIPALFVAAEGDEFVPPHHR